MKVLAVFATLVIALCATMARATPSQTNASALIVKTNYKAIVLNYDPDVLVRDVPTRAATYYGFRNVDQLISEYTNLFRRATSGQVSWSVEVYNLNEFPPPKDQSRPAFEASNYVTLRAQGYDYGQNPLPGPAYDQILRDERFGIFEKARREELDAIWIFAPPGCAFAETAMVGPTPFWINGNPITEPDLARNLVVYGFGKESHQGVGFMCENTAHMAENIMTRISEAWPRTVLSRTFTTLNLDNPNRRLEERQINDWTHFTQSGSASWDPWLVSPFGSQAGLSHFPPTAVFNYDWSTVELGFEGAIWRIYDGSWRVENGEFRVEEGEGAKVLAFDGMGMFDELGNYHPPLAFSDGDVALSVRALSAPPDSHAGFLFRVNGCSAGLNRVKGYYLGVSVASQQLFLAKLDDGLAMIAAAPVSVSLDTAVRLRLSVRGSEFTVYLNDATEPVLRCMDETFVTGAFGLTSYFGKAAFSPISLVAYTINYADKWYRYPSGVSPGRYISPLEWNGDRPGEMDRFYAWWWEHLPKNSGSHYATNAAGGGGQSLLLNNWLPYIFDVNRFATTVPAEEVQFPPEDVTPPERLASVQAIALSHSQVGLSWDEPYDNIGVTRYALFRDGVLLRQSALPYCIDKGLVPGRTYTYSVQALDGAGNASAPSQPISVITPPVKSDFFASSFEVRPEATDWFPDAFRSDAAVFQWEAEGSGRHGSRCISIKSAEWNDARWLHKITGLVPGASYWVSGWIKGIDITREPGRDTGANLCIFGTWQHAPDYLDGSFDWKQVSFSFVAPDSGEVTIGCRLGYWSNTTSGKVFFDDVIVSRGSEFRLSDVKMLTAGMIELQLLAEPGQPCRIEGSSDLKEWGLVQELTPVHPVTSVYDTTQSAARFYRAVK